MNEEIVKHHRRSTYLAERIRVMIARKQVEDYPSVFYGLVKENEECMKNIASEIEKHFK